MEAGMSFIREFSVSAGGTKARNLLRQLAIATLGAVIGVALLFGLILLMTFAWIAFAQARSGPQWAGAPVAVREWFNSLMQPDNPYVSCCGEADAFEADTFAIDGDHYVAVITDGKGVIPPGTRIPVPNAKMKWDKGNPTGHGIIFIGSEGQVYCYVAPGGV
jgi:hypothetical protein